MGVVLMEPGNEYTGEEDLCAIATWTDWDLGVCLKYECSRKQIRKSAFFNQWIDIRAVYKVSRAKLILRAGDKLTSNSLENDQLYF